MAPAPQKKCNDCGGLNALAKKKCGGCGGRTFSKFSHEALQAAEEDGSSDEDVPATGAERDDSSSESDDDEGEPSKKKLQEHCARELTYSSVKRSVKAAKVIAGIASTKGDDTDAVANVPCHIAALSAIGGSAGWKAVYGACAMLRPPSSAEIKKFEHLRDDNLCLPALINFLRAHISALCGSISALLSGGSIRVHIDPFAGPYRPSYLTGLYRPFFFTGLYRPIFVFLRV